MGDDREAAMSALADATLLGDDPTPQELALGDVVAEHIKNRPRRESPPADPAVLERLRKEGP